MQNEKIKQAFLVMVWMCIGVVVLYILFADPHSGDDDGRIVIEYAYPGLPHEKVVYKALIEAFEAKHPHIKVKEVHPAAGLDIRQKIQIQIAGRVPPDVFWMDIGSMQQYAKYGGLIPLDDFIEEEGYDLSDFQPQVFLEGAMYDGKLYGLPRELNCCLTFYNKDYFRDKGVPTPSELAAKGEWNWDTFVEAGKILTDTDKRIYSHNVDFHHPWLLSPILNSFGAKLLDVENKRSFLDSPTSVSVLNMLKDFIHVDGIRPQVGEAEGRGDLFASGQVAMSFVGRWMVPLYSDIEQFEWGVAPFPAGPEGSKTPLVGAYHCIPRDARHPAEAWELVKFLSSVEGQAISAKMGLIIPVRESVANSDAYMKYPGMDEEYNRVFIDEIYTNGVLLPIDEHFNEMMDMVYRGLENAFYGRESIESAVSRINPQIEELMRAGD